MADDYTDKMNDTIKGIRQGIRYKRQQKIYKLAVELIKKVIKDIDMENSTALYKLHPKNK